MKNAKYYGYVLLFAIFFVFLVVNFFLNLKSSKLDKKELEAPFVDSETNSSITGTNVSNGDYSPSFENNNIIDTTQTGTILLSGETLDTEFYKYSDMVLFTDKNFRHDLINLSDNSLDEFVQILFRYIFYKNYLSSINTEILADLEVEYSVVKAFVLNKCELLNDFESSEFKNLCNVYVSGDLEALLNFSSEDSELERFAKSLAGEVSKTSNTSTLLAIKKFDYYRENPVFDLTQTNSSETDVLPYIYLKENGEELYLQGLEKAFLIEYNRYFN